MICGRDTDTLDGQGVVMATIESVAENSVDGVTAPLFYGLIAGPVGVMVYKAISTLDSTFGYKNERYFTIRLGLSQVGRRRGVSPKPAYIPFGARGSMDNGYAWPRLFSGP